MKGRYLPYVTLGVLMAGAIAAGIEIERHEDAGSRQATADVSGISAQFSLTTSDGRSVTDQTYRGKWLLVYFGFTACPEACPTTLLSIGAALEALGPRGRDVQPLFITIDPAHDTQQEMARYLASFNPRIVGLVGTPAQIAAVVSRYRAYAASRSLGGGKVAIDHSSFIYIVNPEGRVTSLLTGDLPGHALAGALRRAIG